VRTKTNRTAEFSMSQLGADFESHIANFAPYNPDNVVVGAMGGKNYVQGAAKQVENAANAAGKAAKAVGKAAGGIGNTIKNAADSVAKQAVAAKNKVAVLVKGENGKMFVQQRWKNVQDAVAKGAAFVKANPGKTAGAAAVLGGTYVAGRVIRNKLGWDEPGKDPLQAAIKK
jgi:flagellar hook-basal body complex protein FliE